MRHSGLHIVVHSGTKFLAGHNDTLAGFLVTNREDISEKLRMRMCRRRFAKKRNHGEYLKIVCGH